MYTTCCTDPAVTFFLTSAPFHHWRNHLHNIQTCVRNPLSSNESQLNCNSYSHNKHQVAYLATMNLSPTNTYKLVSRNTDCIIKILQSQTCMLLSDMYLGFAFEN